jgi:small subunit ribosomal protein S5
MAELLDESSSLESTTVGVYRTSATVKGGRRFSFSALVVVGDRAGRVGLGYAKSNQVPQAIEKAQKVGKRRMKAYPMIGRTIPHAVTGRFGACSVRLVPASPGTGVIAGAATRAVLEMLGVQDCLTKAFGSTNPKNLTKAALDGLGQLRTKELIGELRGVALDLTSVEQAIEKSKAFMTTSGTGEKAKAPVNTVGMETKGGRGGRGGRGGPGGGGGGRGRRREGPAEGEAAEPTAGTAEA